MGAKEESLAVRVLFGYAGQMRPLQVVGGACTVCGQPVWINLPPPVEVRSTEYTHFSCHNARWLATHEHSKRAWRKWDGKQIAQELAPWPQRK